MSNVTPLPISVTVRAPSRPHVRSMRRGARGLAYAAYVSARTWLRFMRRHQRRQARALELAWWDYARGRAGDRRGPDLRLRDHMASS